MFSGAALSKSVKRHRSILRGRQKVVDFLAAYFGLFALFLALIECGYYYEEIQRFNIISASDFEIILVDLPESGFLTGVRCIILIFSVVQGACILTRHILEAKILYENYVIQGIYHRGEKYQWWVVVVEVLYSFVVMPPRANYNFKLTEQGNYFIYYSADMLVTTLMQGRFYLLGRVFLHFSRYGDDHAEDLCVASNTRGGIWFVIKCELKEKPYFMMTILFTISIFVLGFSIRQAELPYMNVSLQNWKYIWNGMWVIFLTMTTVGYGDSYPITSLGRVLCVLGSLIGQFFISLMIVALVKTSAFTLTQKKGYENILRNKLIAEKKKGVELVLLSGLKFWRDRRKKPPAVYRKSYYNLRQAVAQFQQTKRLLITNFEVEIELEDFIDLIYDKVDKSYGKLELAIMDSWSLSHKLKELEEKQNNVESLADVLHKALEEYKNNITADVPMYLNTLTFDPISAGRVIFDDKAFAFSQALKQAQPKHKFYNNVERMDYNAIKTRYEHILSRIVSEKEQLEDEKNDNAPAKEISNEMVSFLKEVHKTSATAGIDVQTSGSALPAGSFFQMRRRNVSNASNAPDSSKKLISRASQLTSTNEDLSTDAGRERKESSEFESMKSLTEIRKRGSVGEKRGSIEERSRLLEENTPFSSQRSNGDKPQTNLEAELEIPEKAQNLHSVRQPITEAAQSEESIEEDAKEQKSFAPKRQGNNIQPQNNATHEQRIQVSPLHSYNNQSIFKPEKIENRSANPDKVIRQLQDAHISLHHQSSQKSNLTLTHSGSNNSDLGKIDNYPTLLEASRRASENLQIEMPSYLKEIDFGVSNYQPEVKPRKVPLETNSQDSGLSNWDAIQKVNFSPKLVMEKKHQNLGLKDYGLQPAALIEEAGLFDRREAQSRFYQGTDHTNFISNQHQDESNVNSGIKLVHKKARRRDDVSWKTRIDLLLLKNSKPT